MIALAVGSIRKGVVGSVAAGVLLAVLVAVPSAVADGPVWNVRAIVAPANLTPGGEGEVIVTGTNLGDMASHPSGAEPIKVSAKLPAGVTATSIEGDGVPSLDLNIPSPQFTCEVTSLVCEATGGTVLMYQWFEIVIHVAVASDAQSGRVGMSVSGGGAAPVSVSDPLTVGGAATKFGVERFEVLPLNADGSLDTQAGSHPFQLTTTIMYNQAFDEEAPEGLGLPRDQTFNMPPGLVGNATAVPQCRLDEFQGGSGGTENLCPADTQVGAVLVFLSLRGTVLGNFVKQPISVLTPVYNLVPQTGEPARFGFIVRSTTGQVPIFLDTSLRTGGDYGVVVSVNNISQEVEFEGAQLSFWGDPGDPLHDLARGECLLNGEFGIQGCEQVTPKPAPFLTLPPSCSGLSDPFNATVQVTSWEQSTIEIPSTYMLQDGVGEPVGLDGCSRLPFESSISVAPDSQDGSTPSGLTVGLHVNQEAALNANGLADADVKDTTVTLPEGVALNPAAADGLQACTDVAEPGRPEGEIALGSREPIACPEASKVGTVEIRSPLLPNALTGAVYLAAQNANPFGSLVALYLVAEDPVSGTLIKIAGEVKLDPVSGQLVSTFDNTPQLPFEDLKLSFFGGDRAPLATPSSCGSYTTTASIVPWSGNEPASPSSTFDIASGPNGSACAGPLPFSPSLAAGTTNIQAGAFSAFTMTMSREDGQQDLQGIQLHMPAGLSGLLSGVKLCGEGEADAGTCGPESQIGETTVSVGLGSDPYSVRGGRAYITGPYHGAPFGLSIVVPAKAGPYDLGQVIVRGKIEVDPITAALTITTDSTGPYAIPHILDGIPLEIKHVNFTTTRTAFTFNPTNCDPMSITGSLTSVEGSSKALSVPFQVTNCGILAFKPGFSASTSGRTSRADGASLKVKLTYPKTVFGSQANIKSVKVDLPKQLPSRLTTLQKACTANQFQANPAGCPAASMVGHAKAITPLIPVPLEGPAYFVSYGGAKFPELVVVLQGYGVTLNLHGETFISKAGITSSTFRTIPDAPVGSFELTLPQGKYSALAANGNLCASKLTMPTAFIAQDGATIKQSTPVTAAGCPKKKVKKAAHKTKKRKRK